MGGARPLALDDTIGAGRLSACAPRCRIHARCETGPGIDCECIGIDPGGRLAEAIDLPRDSVGATLT